MNLIYHTIIIGAGQFGISLSCKLQDQKHNHIVLEKDSIGSTWIKQRWDSFRLVTPKIMNTIERGDQYFSNHSEYLTAQEFQKYLVDKSKERNLPVMENHEVRKVQKNEKGEFELSVFYNDLEINLKCKNLVIASGSLNQKYIPVFDLSLHDEINQLHSSEYKNLNDIQNGNTVVVGSGQSGMQLAEEISSKSNVILLTSKVGRIPRTYLKNNIEEWFIRLKNYEKTYSDSSLDERNETTPGVINENIYMDYEVKNRNIELAGSLKEITNDALILNYDLDANLSFQEKYFTNTLLVIDGELKLKKKSNVNFPHANYLKSYNQTIKLSEQKIKNIVWATGFKAKFSFLNLDVFDEQGKLIHKNGISEIKGLYFLGLPWMRKRKSGIIYGVDEDPNFIAQHLIT